MNGHSDASFQYGIFLFLSVKKGSKTDFQKSKIEIQSLVDRLGVEAANMVVEKSKMNLNVLVYEGKFHQITSNEEQGAWRISAIVFKR
jgi:50S ribosomal subunit-associated GTPase HflX